MKDKNNRLSKRVSLREVFLVLSVSLILALCYFYKEKKETYTSKHFNLIAREIPIVVKNNPGNFQKDPVTNPENIRGIKYIWTQEFILDRLTARFDNFHAMRRFMLSALVMLTALSTYILYKSLTGHIIFSLIAVIVSITGYTNGMWVDSSYGFEGISQAISRYNLGVFAPLYLLLFLKFFNSTRALSILFFLLGLGVNLHPPVAINMAIVMTITVFIDRGVNRQACYWAIIYMVVFIAGALPFILSFKNVILTRGVVEAPINANEFYSEGLVQYTTLFLSSPFKTMLYGLLFPPFISYLAITIISLQHIRMSVGPSPNASSGLKTLKILATGMIVCFILFFLNEVIIGIVLPRLIGPHAFSLHRIARVFFPFAQTLLILLIWKFWNGNFLKKKTRTVLSSILLFNIFMGFNWIAYAGRIRHVFPVFTEESAYLTCAALFLSMMIVLTVCFFRVTMQNKSRLLILIVIFVTLPNIIFIGSDRLIRIFPFGTFGEKFITLNHKKTDDFNSLKEIVRWARTHTQPSDLFLFVTDDETDSYYFKTRAVRSTFYTFSEITHYFPLRKIKLFTQRFKILDRDTRAAIQRQDRVKLLNSASKYHIDYIVLTRTESKFLEDKQTYPEFKNGTFAVFRTKNSV